MPSKRVPPKREFRDRDFDNGEVIEIDGGVFTGCTFRNCTIVFRGTGAVLISGNSFYENINWRFSGPAGTTMKFLSALYAGGAQDLVERTFDNIRNGTLEA